MSVLENEEVQALLADFETVWRRVSPQKAEETEEGKTQKPAAASPEPELCSGRVPRWFGVF